MYYNSVYHRSFCTIKAVYHRQFCTKEGVYHRLCCTKVDVYHRLFCTIYCCYSKEYYIYHKITRVWLFEYQIIQGIIKFFSYGSFVGN